MGNSFSTVSGSAIVILLSHVPALQKEKIREGCLIHRRSYGFWWFFLLSSFQCVVCIAHGEFFFSFALCGGVLIPVFTPLFFLNHTMEVVFRYALVLILILHPPKYFNFFHFCYWHLLSVLSLFSRCSLFSKYWHSSTFAFQISTGMPSRRG